MSAAGIPQLAAVLGSCTAGGAYVPAMSDENVIVRGQGTIFLGGPPLVKAAIGEVVTPEQLGGGDLHARVSGVTDHLADDDAHALDILRDAVATLPAPHPRAWQVRPSVPPVVPEAELYGVVPAELQTAYDVREDGSVQIVDEFVKTRYICRDDEHVYRYGVSDEYIYCDHCGFKTTVGRNFSGILILEDYYMFYEDGGFSTGWKHNGRDVYYFSPYVYMGVDGTQLIDGHVYVFENYVLVEGAWFEEDGVNKLMWAGEVLTNTWHTQRGNTYYFFEDGSCATGTVEITFTDENGDTVTGTYLFGYDGVLIEQIA
jgi:hypothetical protein